MATLDFGGVQEEVILPGEFPSQRLAEQARSEKICVLGYGPQGSAQALNLRDNGMNVRIYQRKGGKGYEVALKDGWQEGGDLFDRMEDVVPGSSVIVNLLSDAGQSETWRVLEPLLQPESMGKAKALIFAHGFSVVFSARTGVTAPPAVDTILVAPKGAGSTLRKRFLEKANCPASFNVRNDVSGRAELRGVAYAHAVGINTLYKTSFENEVYLDLVGERGVLLGAIAGLMKAQYDMLRSHGHTPSEAFNESVEEATQSLYPLIGEKGLDWMFQAASATAQRGALDWSKRFEAAVKPLFEELYKSVVSGKETEKVIQTQNDPGYRDRLEHELEEIRRSEMWKAGSTIRSLR